MHKIVRIMILLACGSYWSYAEAGPFQLGVEIGQAYPDDNDYQETDGIRLVAGYELIDNALLAEIGVFDFTDDFGLDNRAASLELEGTDFQISGIFGLGRANALLGVGVFYWDAEAFFDNRRVGEDSGSSLLLDIRLAFDLSSHFSLYADGKHLHDVSGENINLLMFGSRFSF